MTPTVDPNQLAALRTLRQAFGEVQVLEVFPSPLLEEQAGEQGELLEVK